MYKVLWLLKRKAGISLDQFRDHYESSHSVLGQKYFGHLLETYKRNYKVETWGGGVTGDDGAKGFGPRPWEHDCVTEWVMADKADFEQIMGLLADPVISRVFHEDEEHFLDREATVLIKCDPHDTGPGDGAETLRLKGAG